MEKQQVLDTLASYSNYKKNLHLKPKINIFENINIITSTINSILVFIAIIDDDLDYIIKLIIAILNITVLFGTNLYKILIDRNVSPVHRYVSNQWSSLTNQISLLKLEKPLHDYDYEYKNNNIREQFLRLKSIEPDDSDNFTL